jgi:hypothetical protein
MKRVIMFALLFLLSNQLYAQPAWELAAPMQTARMDAASAVINDTLYVMGGRQTETGSGTGNEGFVDVVEAYVPLTNSWLTDFPSLPSPAALQASAVVGRRIYLLGGLAPEGQTLDCIWYWEPGEPSWTEGSILPYAVEGAAAVSLIDSTILLIGGLTAGGEYMDEVLFLFPETYDDSDPAPELDQARAGAGAVRVRDVVLVTGGYFYGPVANCELFGGTNWATGPQLLHSTGSHLACVSGTITFVVGGQGQGGPLADVLLLHGPHGEWVLSGHPMSIARARLAGGVVAGFLVAAGGIGREGSTALGSVERVEVDIVGGSPMEEPQPVQPSLTIMLWPNPASAHLSVAAELGVHENWELVLHNPAGRVVWSSSGFSERIQLAATPVGGLKSGVYLLTLLTTTRTASTPVAVLE